MIGKPTGLPRNIYLDPRDDQSPLGFMVQAIDMQSASDVVPRFSTSAPGETDLDLIKAKTLTIFKGGQYQRIWDDDTKVAVAKGIFNPALDVLLPTLPIYAAQAVPIKTNEVSHAKKAKKR